MIFHSSKDYLSGSCLIFCYLLGLTRRFIIEVSTQDPGETARNPQSSESSIITRNSRPSKRSLAALNQRTRKRGASLVECVEKEGTQFTNHHHHWCSSHHQHHRSWCSSRHRHHHRQQGRRQNRSRLRRHRLHRPRQREAWCSGPWCGHTPDSSGTGPENLGHCQHL